MVMFWNHAPKAKAGATLLGPGVKKAHVKESIKAKNSVSKALGIGATAVVKTKRASIGGVGKGGMQSPGAPTMPQKDKGYDRARASNTRGSSISKSTAITEKNIRIKK